MALEVIFGASIPRELTTPVMEFLWVKWKTLRATGGLDLQRLTEETQFQLRPNLAYMTSHRDDFIYLYIGEKAAPSHGHAVSGNVVSGGQGPRKLDFLKVYRQVAETMTPAFVRFTGDSLSSGQFWIRIVLPIRLAGDAVMLVCYSEAVSHQIEVYEHLFRTAPDAMVIACPITNEAGHSIDGWVTMMNDSARALLDYEGKLSNLRLSDIAQFNRVELWERLHGVRQGKAMRPVLTDSLVIDILRFPHAFGLKLAARAVPHVEDSGSLAPGATLASRNNQTIEQAS